MSLVDKVRELVATPVAELGLGIYDVEHNGGVLRVTVDHPDGLDLDALTAATRAISQLLDENDPLPGSYRLEVSSPGLERTLRRPEHFGRAIGERVTVKTLPEVDGERRVEGILRAADDEGIAIESDAGTEHRLGHEQIQTARTVFEWGPEAGGAKRDAERAAS